MHELIAALLTVGLLTQSATTLLYELLINLLAHPYVILLNLRLVIRDAGTGAIN